MRLTLLLLTLLVVLGAASPAHAQEPAASARPALAPADAASLLSRANGELYNGAFADALASAQLVLDLGPEASREERLEAYRILALSSFYQERPEDARRFFLEFLRLDPDSHLDPAMVPPEAVTMLEDVRAENAAELAAFRKKPKKKRYLVMNLVPAGGQFQNGERVKGFVLVTGMGTLLAANLASYFLLKHYCSEADRTCRSGDVDRTNTAQSLQTVNLLSGVTLSALYAYSVIDGVLGYRRIENRERMRENYMSLSVSPTEGGASFAWSLSF